ncbi:hypothetical protein Fmac_019276 [Flemingia macrophylla]|uniref:Uncharacterized protein n=1 Tax=Flemingia macrophylla TaxID=520843 RepID=A0ABD1M7B7_9FABA
MLCMIMNLQPLLINTNMIATYIVEFFISNSIKLNSENMVMRIAFIAEIEKTDILS